MSHTTPYHLNHDIDPHRKRIRRIVPIKKHILIRRIIVSLLNSNIGNRSSGWVTREMKRQQAPGPATFLFCRFPVASRGHALRLWTVASRRVRCVQICGHATETIAASIDASDGKLGGMTCGCACLQRDLSMKRAFVRWQKQALGTSLPVTVVVAANCMMDVNLALAAWRRWAGWCRRRRHGRHEIVKHHRRVWPYTNEPTYPLVNSNRHPVLLHEAGHTGAPVMLAL